MAALSVALLGTLLVPPASAQDQGDDPPVRVARLGHIEGSVSFQPAGESEWVEAVPNRPMTTGDRIWTDRDSRAELQLGSAMIDVNSNTGVSFLNLDDRTIQVELSSGAVNIRVRGISQDNVFEIDTPNQAFSIFQPGRYRVEASEDGTYTIVSIREGQGESTGNGQTYDIYAGQRATLEGTDYLDARLEDIGPPDNFDNWSYGRFNLYENAQSGRYISRDMVGYEDLDGNGDWMPAPGYGSVWFPHVDAGWAPYREGHWAWIDPWGWTWVDDEPWGYAPFHYGRWLSVEGRWGWVPGPMDVAPVYAPALVVFVGGGPGFGGNIAWFPLGPREVYVPSYPVSRAYIERINVSNTTVTTTTITNVYNTTIIRNNTTIQNVTYVNRGVAGAVTAVPQQTFVSAQPVAKAVVRVNPQQLAAASVVTRAAVAPTSNSVLGAHAATANHVVAPPAAIARRQVVAKAAVPAAPVPFAARQQALQAHPGQPVARQEMRQLRPANAAPASPMVKQAPPGKPATPAGARPGNPQANQPNNRPENRPENQRPGNARPGNEPAPGERPMQQPPARTQSAPAAPPAQNNRPVEPPARNERPAPPQENNRPEANRPAEPPARNERPAPAPQNQANRPESDRPQTPAAKEPPQRTQPAARPENQQRPAAPAETRPAAKPQQPQRPLTPAEKKKQEEDQKREKPPA
ncbi:MAG: DUF6600 domain-containing protein [Terriglobales bacterium]